MLSLVPNGYEPGVLLPTHDASFQAFPVHVQVLIQYFQFEPAGGDCGFTVRAAVFTTLPRVAEMVAVV